MQQIHIFANLPQDGEALLRDIVSSLEQLGANVTVQDISGDTKIVIANTDDTVAANNAAQTSDVTEITGTEAELPPELVPTELTEPEEPVPANPAPYDFKKCRVLSLSTQTEINSVIDPAAPYSSLAVKTISVDDNTQTVRFSFGGFSFTLPQEGGGTTIRAVVSFDGAEACPLVLNLSETEDLEVLVIGQDFVSCLLKDADDSVQD